MGDIPFEYTHACGQCMPCRVNKKSEWTTRILWESQAHDYSSFCTLTYSPEQLPQEGLRKSDLQGFFKRLRSRLDYAKKTPIRYYACGEYGEKTKRPHYHAILFGLPHSELEEVEQSWKLGFSQLSEFNPARAAYVARYTMKKLTSPDSFSDGRAPEFGIMSRKPGLGHTMLQLHGVNLLAGGYSMRSGLLKDTSGSTMATTLPAYLRYKGKLHRTDNYMRKKIGQMLDEPQQHSTQKTALLYERYKSGVTNTTLKQEADDLVRSKRIFNKKGTL